MPAWLAICLTFVGIVAFVVLAYRRRWQWTGLPAGDGVDNAGARPAKTLWNWLELLGIPVALAALAFLLNNAQTEREQRRDDQRVAQQRRVAADTEQENVLRTYLAQMSELMLERHLLIPKPRRNVRVVARTATLTALRRLDGARRGLVVRFLAEALLIRRDDRGVTRVHLALADLAHADLADASLRAIDLSGANLRDANLRSAYALGADLQGAQLHGADLSRALLIGGNINFADFAKADLHRADLSEAYVNGANLSGVNLRASDLSGAHLYNANLVRADLRRANLRRARLGDANLHQADLREANLQHVDLTAANLSQADLHGTHLAGAYVRGADLRGAQGVDLTGSRGKPAHSP